MRRTCTILPTHQRQLSIVSVPVPRCPARQIQLALIPSWGKGDDDATFHEGEGESLSNRPWQMKVMKRAVPYHRKEWIITQTTPPPISRSPQSNGGLQPSRDPGELNSRSSASLQGKHNHSPWAASPKTRNGPSHWRTWPICQPQCKEATS